MCGTTSESDSPDRGINALSLLQQIAGIEQGSGQMKTAVIPGQLNKDQLLTSVCGCVHVRPLTTRSFMLFCNGS